MTPEKKALQVIKHPTTGKPDKGRDLIKVPRPLRPTTMRRRRTRRGGTADTFCNSTMPRIAVTGLNPHAGEEGKIGGEDAAIIGPAIAELRESGLSVTGPHPADTLFHERARAGYDVALCMYHDQALIPIKTLAFDNAVNVTLGLPFVRTSPDHGTAFDIAGSGKADPSSLVAALALAARLSANTPALVPAK